MLNNEPIYPRTTMANSWRCVLIGGESLLIQCAEILEQRGHAVAAIVSGRPAIRKWAAARGVRVLADAAALRAAGDLGRIDYLFSVTNLSVLPADVLAMPVRGAINFHDGPLPEYAGLNTPVWALLNGETAYGITWHTMTAQVDQGDILVQKRFALGDADTSLTLNTRNYEAAIEGFEELMAGLEAGTLVGQPQTRALERYYGRKDRPEAACAIRWDQPSDRIATLVRALDFGTYANPIGTAKLSVAGRVLLVAATEKAATSSGAQPGTVVAADLSGITVATADGDLRLTRLEATCGRAVSAGEAQSEFGLRAGTRLDVPSADAVARLSGLNAEVCPHEGFWLRRLETQETVELPTIDRSAPPQPAQWTHLDAAHPAGAGERGDTLVAAALGLLARLADKDAFDVGFADTALADQVGADGAWFAAQVPLRAEIDFALPFARLRDAVAAERAQLRRRGTFATDAVARTPELRAMAVARDPRVLPVSVLLVRSLDAAAGRPGNELTVAFTDDGRASRWVFDAAKLSRGQVQALQAQFAELLAAADADAQRPLAELPLLDAALRHRVLDDWNATAAPVRADACVHRLFAEQAARTPDRDAVTCNGVTLTYAELDRRSSQLARRLSALGVGPDSLVGLMAERSVELIVGLIGIHKAGGAYVPLDPTYPRDRIAYMVEDAGLRHLHFRLHRQAQGRDGAAWATSSTFLLAWTNVVIPHDPPAGTWLAVTSTSFDISVLELFWTLARGFKVVIFDDKDAR
jgi:methionyl-tRNA formyltransferase